MSKLKCSGTVNTSCSTCGTKEVAVYFLLKENKTKHEGKFTLHEWILGSVKSPWNSDGQPQNLKRQWAQSHNVIEI